VLIVGSSMGSFGILEKTITRDHDLVRLQNGRRLLSQNSRMFTMMLLPVYIPVSVHTIVLARVSRDRWTKISSKMANVFFSQLSIDLTCQSTCVMSSRYIYETELPPFGVVVGYGRSYAAAFALTVDDVCPTLAPGRCLEG
jgi:hypothetical protein